MPKRAGAFLSYRPFKRARTMRKLRKVYKRKPRHSRRRFSKKKGSGFSRNFSFPKSKSIQCKYNAAYANISPGNAGVLGFSNTYTTRANSPYDPEYGATGGFNQKAAGYTLWANLYDHYTVVSSKITYIWRQAQTLAVGVNAADIKCGIKLNDASSFTGTTWVALADDPSTVVGTLHCTADNKGYCKLTKYFSAKKFFGLSHPMDNKDEIGAGIGSNPSDIAYFIPFWQDAAIGTQTGVTFNLEIKATYNVVFTERKDISNLPAAAALDQV